MTRKTQIMRGHRPTRSATLALIAGLALAAPLTAQDDGGAPAQPDQPERAPGQQEDPQEEMISLSGFSGPVQLTALLEFTVETLKVDIAVSENLGNQAVEIYAPVSFPKSELLTVVNTLLESKGFRLESAGLENRYIVSSVSNVTPSLEGPLAATEIIFTPNVTPSSLRSALEKQFNIGATTGSTPAIRLSFLDDAGIIVVTATQTQMRACKSLINRILEESRQELIRIEVRHISATAAIDQAAQLVGLVQQQTNQPNVPQPGGGSPGNQGSVSGESLNNLTDRLTVAPVGNALFFRGRRDEIDAVLDLIDIIDQPSDLVFRRYFTGSETRSIGRLAANQGLGDQIELQAETPFGFPQQNQFPGQQQNQNVPLGASKVIVAPERGWIYYYGTTEQQDRFASLVENFKAEDELPVAQVYRLEHSDAEQIAEVINGLIQGTQQQNQSPLLPQNQRGAAGQQIPPQNFTPPGEGESEEGSFNPGLDVIVIADATNNQIIVRAPKRQQREFERLIKRLDLRRPQVFLDAKIVAVSGNEDFRLRFESQILAGQFGISTNFGVTEFGDNPINSLPSVPGGLQGLTSAVIKSEYVPFVMTALQSNTDSRILASPRLLVNDNEETTLVNATNFPFAEVSQGNATTQTAFTGERSAGTTFTVEPRISAGDYINLTYALELSAFIGDPPAEGAPPPSQETSIENGSVTVPGGTTIIVGGLEFDNDSDTIVKIPILGDIPIIGHLFRDTQKSGETTRIYVFITPYIMRSANFGDLVLLSQGPFANAELDPDIPPLPPRLMRLSNTSDQRNQTLDAPR